MHTIRRLLIPAGAAGLLLVVLAVAAPRVAHAVTAALVQVVNTPANPVPVTPAQTTTVIARFQANVPTDGSIIQFGPYDVSQFSNIRFYGDPPGPPQVSYELLAVDLNTDNRWVLDELTTLSTGSITRAYDLPGANLFVRVSATCPGTCPSSTQVTGILYGR